MQAYQDYIHVSKYSRYLDTEGRRETWVETVHRYIQFWKDMFSQHDIDWDELEVAICKQKAMPSMRALMTAGRALEKDNMAGFNCAASAVSSPRVFDEAFYILMCGTGFGFSVERKYTEKLPVVNDEMINTGTIIGVADSKLGWAGALKELIAMLYTGNIPTWDLSKVRAAGERLKTFGGRACLTGDTILYKDRKKARGYNEITIKDLFDMERSQGKWKNKPNHFKSVKLRSLNEETGQFYRNNIITVIDNGVAPVYKIVTKNGYTIKATSNHRFMNEVGDYAHVEDFAVGVGIAVNGSTEKKTGICVVSYDEIVSIDHIGDEPVYDLQMKAPDHNFVANGFVSHNSGPEPLDRLFQYTVRLFKRSAGRQLTGIECHDLMCQIAKTVIVGSVRRSACISFSNLSDLRMRDAKAGDWYFSHPERSLANNSVMYTCKPDLVSFLDEFKSLYTSKTGERGICNQNALKKKASGCGRDYEGDYLLNPCGEAILRDSGGLCNLSEIIPRPSDKLKDLKEKARFATIFGTLQSSLTDFRYVRKVWQKNAIEDPLLGVSITGIMDHTVLSGWDEQHSGFPQLRRWLKEMKEVVTETNLEWADKLGIKPATQLTLVKPSGTVSQLVNCSSGMHPRHSPYILRKVAQDMKDPLSQMMIDQGVPYYEDADKYYFEFPIMVPDKSVCINDINPVYQLELWKVYQDVWCDGNPSQTIYYDDDSFLNIQNWVWENWDSVGGLSFFPKNDNVYENAPYNEITKEEYNERIKAFPDINYSDLSTYENGDHTTSGKEFACSGGACDL